MNTSNSNLNFNENQWVIQIRRTLEEETEEEDAEIAVSIFSVPKALIANNPEAYAPQQVALGPYHYWRSELYEMERYKLAAAKITQKNLHTLGSFQDIVDHFINLESRIRACYHKYLDFNGETLAWMMAVDASFMLEFLQVYGVKEGKLLKRSVTSRMSHLLDFAGRKLAHNAILRDMLMLENQLPLFILRKMLEFQFSSLDLADDILVSMLRGLCKELFPFKMMDIELPKVLVKDCAHVLDFFYRLLLPKSEEPLEITILEADEDDQDEALKEIDQDEKPSEKCVLMKLLQEIWKLLSKVNKGQVRLIKVVLQSKPFKVMSKLPWTIISKLLGFKLLKKLPTDYIGFSKDKESVKTEKDNTNRPPLMEEISIPCVVELYKAGVCILPTNGGIFSISFDKKTFTLRLPIINLDVNSEVIYRNLVAYEACNASGPLVFTRFTKFLNGIVDSKEDAALLRERGIILNRLKSDEEVTNLCNGMSRSVKLSKVPFLDTVIEDVNKYYNGRWKIKARNCIKRYVYGSWQILTLLVCILLLFLMSLQAFCSVYSCARVLQLSKSTDE